MWSDEPEAKEGIQHDSDRQHNSVKPPVSKDISSSSRNDYFPIFACPARWIERGRNYETLASVCNDPWGTSVPFTRLSVGRSTHAVRIALWRLHS
jgi:hypothetical protein